MFIIVNFLFSVLEYRHWWWYPERGWLYPIKRA